MDWRRLGFAISVVLAIVFVGVGMGAIIVTYPFVGLITFIGVLCIFLTGLLYKALEVL